MYLSRCTYEPSPQLDAMTPARLSRVIVRIHGLGAAGPHRDEGGKEGIVVLAGEPAPLVLHVRYHVGRWERHRNVSSISED